MRKFDLSKKLSLESQSEVAAAEQETLEVLEPVVVRDPQQDESEELESGIDELTETTAALESLMFSLESSLAKGGMTASELSLVKMHSDYLTKRIGLESLTISNESTTTRIAQTQLALEGVKETLHNALKAVMEFLGKLWEVVVKLITGMAKHARDLKKKFQALKGKEFDYNKEVLSLVGNKGKLLLKNGKPNSSCVRDAEEFVSAFYGTEFSSNSVDFNLLAKIFLLGHLTGAELVKQVVTKFPNFFKHVTPKESDEYVGCLEIFWQSPLDGVSVTGILPDPKADDVSFRRCGYQTNVDLPPTNASGSLKDLGIVNVDALIPRLIKAVEEFESKSSAWESNVRRNQLAQKAILAGITDNSKAAVASILSPIGKCVVEPMRSMANIAYQMLYAFEEIFRRASQSEKVVSE